MHELANATTPATASPMLIDMLAVSTSRLRVRGARTYLWRRRHSSLRFDSGISSGFALSRSSSCSSSESRPCSDVEKDHSGPASRRRSLYIHRNLISSRLLAYPFPVCCYPKSIIRLPFRRLCCWF